MSTAIEREVVAGYLSADKLLDVCRAGGRPAALDQIRARVRSSCHSVAGDDLNWRTEHDGVAWHARGGPRGFLRWDDVWRIATAGASPERVDALQTAYRAYVDHTASFVVCPGPWKTAERWREEYSNAYHDRYRELRDAIDAAQRAIVTQPLVEQLDLFGANA